MFGVFVKITPHRQFTYYFYYYISGYVRENSAVPTTSAGMAELADVPDLGSGVPDVRVRVPLPA